MVKRGHIVNCKDLETYERFISDGYIGVGPIRPRNFGPGGRSWAVRANWDIIADLKRVKPRDLVFIHVTGGIEEIRGVFEATSFFKESPDTPEVYKSNNLRYYPPEPCWQNLSEEDFVETDYYWQLGIKEHEGSFFEKGFPSTEVFKLKGEGKIWTIPERWKYADMAKTVRPLIGNEIEELLKILIRNNLGKPLDLSVIPKSLDSFNDIHLLLIPYNDEVYTEKILEAWILENLTYNNGNNSENYKMVTDILGKLNVFGNTIQAFYLDFMDIFGYIEDENGYKYGFKVIELKKGEPDFPGAVKQLIKYMNWVTIELAEGDALKVEGVIIAKRISSALLRYVRARNEVEYGNKINLAQYEIYRNNIILRRIV